MKGVFLTELNPKFKPTWVEKIALVQFEIGLAILGFKTDGTIEVLSFELNSEKCLVEIKDQEALKILACLQEQHNRGNIYDIPGVMEKIEEIENAKSI